MGRTDWTCLAMRMFGLWLTLRASAVLGMIGMFRAVGVKAPAAPEAGP